MLPRKVLKLAIEAVMPKRFAKPLLQQFSDPSKVRVPSATKQSRTRLTLDAAFMLHRRQVHKASMDDSVRYIMADSSVQGHHDLELIRCVTLRVSQHDDMFRCAQELHAGLAEADALEADIQEAAAKERDLLSNISKRFVDPLVSKRCHRQRACKLVPQKSCTSPYRVAGNGRLPLDGSLLQDSAVFSAQTRAWKHPSAGCHRLPCALCCPGPLCQRTVKMNMIGPPGQTWQRCMQQRR